MQAESTALEEVSLSAASPWGIPVQILEETTSSNDELLRLGEKNAPTGTLLFAERQTAGRGQFHRVWSSEKPLGLWFSLLLRLEISDATIPGLSAFAAVALSEALAELDLPEVKIKAPNDLYHSGQKIAGILVETRTGKNPFAVVGIGLNVNQWIEDFPEELKNRATSMALVSGKTWDRNQVAGIILQALGRSETLMRENRESLLEKWNRLLIDPKQLHSPVART